MANDLTHNVWILDTADTAILYPHSVKIKVLLWEAPANVGDDLILLDKHGGTIVATKAEAAGQAQLYRLNKWYSGLRLDTIDSGKLYVHYA